MNRRTVLKRVGIASAGAAAATGNAAAKRSAAGSALADVDATIDVSDVAGEVALADVLSDEQLADLDIDASAVRLTVDPGVNEVTPSDHCCLNFCCEDNIQCPLTCPCCFCNHCDPWEPV